VTWKKSKLSAVEYKGGNSWIKSGFRINLQKNIGFIQFCDPSKNHVLFALSLISRVSYMIWIRKDNNVPICNSPLCTLILAPKMDEFLSQLWSVSQSFIEINKTIKQSALLVRTRSNIFQRNLDFFTQLNLMTF
jgi:hypothetical protein